MIMTKYDNPYFENNVYGHVVHLLEDHLGVGAGSGLYLDFGCSYGRIAEEITSKFGFRYVGLDLDPDALSSLHARGFGAYSVDLNDVAATEKVVSVVTGTNQIGAISLIDVLEHVYYPDALLAMLHGVAARHCCPMVLSVPNVAHRDIGFKLAFGAWDYTDVGLLDRTHLRGFTRQGLRSMVRAAGWHLVKSDDVRIAHSDQHFPKTHPALADGALLHQFLARLRDDVDETATTNQFVGVYLPGPVADISNSGAAAEAAIPFLSIVTRTQGKRIDTLRDVLLCLSAQTSQDFEVCVVGHKLTPKRQRAVERVIDDTNKELRGRIRLLLVDDGNRTRPLNVGFENAHGQYVAILDDDDIVLGNWVESFKELAKTNVGCVLHAGCVSQTWERVTTQMGTESVRAVSGMDARYASPFDFFQHLIENFTPPVSVAFPRAVFRRVGIRFDESLTTTEDWDFLMRTAAICGVADAPEITSIYRKWLGAESSYTIHTEDEWHRNHSTIWHKLDQMPILLEPGSTRRIRYLVDDWNCRHRKKAAPVVETDDCSSRDILRENLRKDLLRERAREDMLRGQISELLASRTWAMGAPVRLLARLGGRKYARPKLWLMDSPQLESYLGILKRSLSWRCAQRVKAIIGMS